MENQNKKEIRNCVDYYNDDEEEEEMKVEKFYSLLRSFRESRNRLRQREFHNQLAKDESNNNNKKKMKTEPCFELQDFTTDFQFREFPLDFSDPVPNNTMKNNNNGEKNEQLKEHAVVDLKLAL
ncbi:hypothetical protein TSUD_38960 [Trifolium subterraneum]|uniref:Uncharacterized protein n=1 Tax=Trifolium subterraneum TaxID=3900 RepID=A0A2Z6M3B1_TRISU|nr:hypothetical protein TSUD_38960 [Trifolium subterraneum]